MKETQKIKIVQDTNIEDLWCQVKRIPGQKIKNIFIYEVCFTVEPSQPSADNPESDVKNCLSAIFEISLKLEDKKQRTIHTKNGKWARTSVIVNPEEKLGVEITDGVRGFNYINSSSSNNFLSHRGSRHHSCMVATRWLEIECEVEYEAETNNTSSSN